MQDRLKALVDEMFEKGVRVADACHEVERHYIARALQMADGNLSLAAKRLGMHRNTLARKLDAQRRAARKYGRSAD